MEMRRIIIIIFSIILLSQIIKAPEWSDGVVQLCWNGIIYATGFFVSQDGKIVTTSHLIPTIFYKQFPVWVRILEEEEIFLQAKILNINRYTDVAILKVNYSPKFYFEKFSNPELNEKVIIIGFPYGWEKVDIKAKIIQDENKGLGVNIFVLLGSSGSPVINLNGEIVGMIKGRKGFGTLCHSHFIRIALNE
jgi:S1-C subfamily serine protease